MHSLKFQQIKPNRMRGYIHVPPEVEICCLLFGKFSYSIFHTTFNLINDFTCFCLPLNYKTAHIKVEAEFAVLLYLHQCQI